jgi:hypothetical protein
MRTTPTDATPHDTNEDQSGLGGCLSSPDWQIHISVQVLCDWCDNKWWMNGHPPPPLPPRYLSCRHHTGAETLTYCVLGPSGCATYRSDNTPLKNHLVAICAYSYGHSTTSIPPLIELVFGHTGFDSLELRASAYNM